MIAPLIALEPIETGPVDLDGYDWLIVTSVTGARELKSRARGQAARVAAIGQATARAWGDVDLVPLIGSQEGLLAEIPRPAGRVLFAGAEGARPLLAEQLGADVVVLYRTRALSPEIDGDLAVVASPSAARALADVNATIPIVTIGPETTAAAQAVGLQVLREAPTADIEGLVRAVEG